MSKLKVGMIGAGQIAKHHLKSISASSSAECIAIADPSLKRAKVLADEFKLKHRYSSAAELLKNKDIDAVSIAVPNKYHAPLAIAALNAGKHVLLDKPFALNYREAAQVAAAAKKSRKVFTLGMNMRFTRETQTIKTLIERGELGDIYHGKACWLRRSGIPSFGTWFCRKSEAGGGGMLDIGVHALDVCMYLMNNFKPVRVSASAYTKMGNRGIGEGGWGISDKGKHVFDVDDFATALIKFKNGATIALDVSWALHQEVPNIMKLQLYGTEAGATTQPAARIFRYSKTKPKEYEVVEPQGVPIRYAHCDRTINWLDAIIGKDKLCCKLEQALTVQKILDAIYQSSRTGNEVKIG
jgi:predicted dehydrogenase